MDEQSNQCTRRVPTDGCSTSLYGQDSTRAPGTASNPALHDAVYDRSSLISTCSICTSRCTTRAGQSRKGQPFCPGRRSTSPYASTQQPKKCYVLKVLRLHNKLPKHKRPWINITRLNGNKQKQTLQLYVNPTAPKCSLLPPRCVRRTRNIKSFMMHKRDSYNSRHKPYEKHINMNSKQRSQLRIIRV